MVEKYFREELEVTAKSIEAGWLLCFYTFGGEDVTYELQAYIKGLWILVTSIVLLVILSSCFYQISLLK